MAKLTIGCFSSLVGSMSLDFAVKLAEAAIEKGHEVDFWMSGNAVMLSKKGQKSFKDYSYLDKTDPRRDGQGDEHVRLRGLRRGARLPQGGHRRPPEVHPQEHGLVPGELPHGGPGPPHRR